MLAFQEREIEHELIKCFTLSNGTCVIQNTGNYNLKSSKSVDDVSTELAGKIKNYMARKNKTTETEVNVFAFINSYVDNDQKKQDSYRLIELMREWSGFEPKMWGPTMIGFGTYHYKYSSGHEGDAMIIGFSPRKTEFSLYVSAPGNDDKKILEVLGKYRMSKSCIYFKKLSDINLEALEQLSKATIKYTTDNLECACRV